MEQRRRAIEWTENKIDHCFNSSKIMWFSVSCGVSSFILSIIGIATESWLVNLSSPNNHIGLWTFCQEIDGIECCSVMSEYTSVPGFIHATRFFAIFGTLVNLVALAATVVNICSDSDFDWCSVLSLGYLIGTISLMIAVSAFGGHYFKEDLTSGYNLHGSFVSVILAMGFSFGAQIIYFCAVIDDT